MRLTLVGCLVVLSLHPCRALADWADPSAAYSCGPSSFVVKAVMETSDPDPGAVPVPLGFTHVTDDGTVTCKLPTITVQAQFEVEPPRSSGTCAGFTHTYIRSMVVNGKELLKLPESFNNECINGPELYEIRIQRVEKAIRLTRCYAHWAWGVGYTQTKCDEQDL